MGTSRRSSVLAIAVWTYLALAVILFVTYGADVVAGLTVIAVLAASYLARRHMDTLLGEHYERHGDRMD
jgi:uncharacterized membrane protein